MDFFADQTSSLLALVRAGANRSARAMSWAEVEIKDLIALDAKLRPPGHAQDSRAFAQRYLGNQSMLIRAALNVRFSLSADLMPVAPLPYIKQWARADSGCYQRPADRYLVDKKTREPTKNAVLKSDFSRRMELSRISEVAPEAERRARTGIKSAVVHVGYLPPIGDDDGRALMRHYFVHDVVIVCHPGYPGEEEAIIFAALRQTSPSGDYWLCYKRDFVEAADHTVTEWGVWHEARWSGGDAGVGPWTEYAGKVLPIAVLRIEPPDGGFWPAAASDVIAQSDTLNTSRSNLDFVTDLQAHSNLLIADDTFDEKKVNIAPDGVIKLRTRGTGQWITPDPDFEAMRANIDERQRAVGAANGNDPNTYSAAERPAESGIARLVQKFPQELTLQESREAVRRFDERLARIVIDVVDAYEADAPLYGTEVRPRTDLAPSVTFEDPGQKQGRALINLQEGAISPAEYAVEVGLAPSVAAAAEAGYSDIAPMRVKAAPAPSVADELVPAAAGGPDAAGK